MLRAGVTTSSKTSSTSSAFCTAFGTTTSRVKEETKSSGLTIATPQQKVISIEDSPPVSANTFQNCGCWMHLEKLHGLQDRVDRVIHVKQERLLLGRDPCRVPHDGLIAGADQNGAVSRVHAQVFRGSSDEPRIVDCGSRNGTVVMSKGRVPASASGCLEKDTRLPGMQLSHCDVIAFGLGAADMEEDF